VGHEYIIGTEGDHQLLILRAETSRKTRRKPELFSIKQVEPTISSRSFKDSSNESTPESSDSFISYEFKEVQKMTAFTMSKQESISK
jgi:hypothetical protein